MRLPVLAPLIAALLVPAASASAHTRDASKPVIVFADGTDCGPVKTLKATLPTIELGAKLQPFDLKQIVTLASGPARSCDESLPAGPETTAGVAERFAAWLTKNYSEPATGSKPAQPRTVDVVAVGSSGVALRYALAESGSEDGLTLDIEDAVTVGSPHTQLTEPEYLHPDGVNGTDWTVIATKADAGQALEMDADHKTTYLADGLTTAKLLADKARERDAQITYEHGDGKPKIWNKAPHGIERIALDLVHGVGSCENKEICASECRQKLAGWTLLYACPGPDQLKRGANPTAVMKPDGERIEFPQLPPDLTFPLPFAKSGRLLVPVVLPDIEFDVGALRFSAVENLLDDEGLTIGSATAQLAIAGKATTLYAQDLRFTADGVAAGALGLEAFGWAFQATGVAIDANAVTATAGQVILPPALGGHSVHFSNLRIDEDGVLNAELSGATIKVGHMTIDLQGFKLTKTGFEAATAGLVLPKYLGDLQLTATNVRWDGESLTFDNASGKVSVSLAGGTFQANAHFQYTRLSKGKAFQLKGAGSIVSPLFGMDATLELESIDCDQAEQTKPGACRNALPLKEAGLRITGKPVPLGSTGLAISGLSGKIIGLQGPAASINTNGTFNDVSYAVSLAARIQSYPNDALFAGDIEGTLSTKGDVALKLKNAQILKYVTVTGGVCVLATDDATVCGQEIIGKGNKITQPGAYIGGNVSAQISGASAFAYGQAGFSGSVFGGFVRRGEEWSTTVKVGGKMWAIGGVFLLGEFDTEGSLDAQIGRFKTSDGVKLGVKGTLSGHVKVKDANGKETNETRTRYLFIDDAAKYRVSSTDDWTPVTAALMRRGTAAQAGPQRFDFELRPRQTQTMIVVEAAEGSPSLELRTPQGRRAVIEAPGTIHPVGRTQAGQLANLHAVRTRAPHSVMAYLPAAAPGRWAATVRGAAPGTYRILVRGNKPVPRLAVTVPSARKPATSGPRHRSVMLRGTLRGATGDATVTVYAGRGGCQQRAGAQLLASGVRVRRGAWRYRWTPKNAPAGRYSVHTDLDNGIGALVAACAKRAVVVKRPAPSRPKRNPSRSQRPRATSAAFATLTAPQASAAATKKVKCGNKPFGDSNPKIPVLYVADFAITKAENGLTVNPLPDIALNDFNAIKEDKQAALLTYGRLDADPPKGAKKCEALSDANRSKACKGFKYKHATKPSCDEYPFASTREGGTGATTMGVPDSQQQSQGGQLSAFLRKYRRELAQLNGKFRVCVLLKATKEHSKRREAGAC